METAIVSLENRVRNIPAWNDASNKLDDENLKHDLMDSLVALTDITIYLGYDAIVSDTKRQDLALSNLQSQIYHLYHLLDDYGVSRIIATQGSDFLRQFSYMESTEFKAKEKELIKDAYQMSRNWGKKIKDLIIPEQAWDRFWQNVDLSKTTMLNQMQPYDSQPPSSSEAFFYSYLYQPYTSTTLHDELGNFTPGPFLPLSPFSWSKALCTALGGILTAVNPLLALPTSGIALTSIIAGTIGNSIAAGFA